MALPKKKKPGLMIAIGVGKPKSAPQDDLGGPKPVDEPDADDQPGGGPSDQDEDDQPTAQGQCNPDPEAVCFRSEQETCQYCDYMQGDRCSHPIVAMPVSSGDSCNAFRLKQQGSEEAQPPMSGQDTDQEPAGEQS